MTAVGGPAPILLRGAPIARVIREAVAAELKAMRDRVFGIESTDAIVP